MSGANATGNNLGVGYTGRSGSEAEPRWVHDEIDLSPYAGQEVLIRFSYVTDDAVHREGVALDEIRIDAVGFRDGAEDSHGGWTLQGWARTGSTLPQGWSLRAIEFQGGKPAVVDLPVDAEGRAQWIAEDRGVERVVLAVAATTTVTLQRGRFRLIVSR